MAAGAAAGAAVLASGAAVTVGVAATTTWIVLENNVGRSRGRCCRQYIGCGYRRDCERRRSPGYRRRFHEG